MTLLETDKVASVWTTQGAIDGRRFTDKITGASIFLPASGYRGNYDGSSYSVGSIGNYWSSSSYSSNNAWFLFFTSNQALVSDNLLSFGKSVRCVRTVNNIQEPVTSVALNRDSATLSIGDTLQLFATVAPANASNKEVTWSSSNTSVATVSNGVVTAEANGSATITVTTLDGEYTATCTITVEPIAVTGVTLNRDSATLFIGDRFQLLAAVEPENAAIREVTWNNSNATVASMDIESLGINSSIVTAESAGSATITVTTLDGEHTATCIVTVKDIPSPSPGGALINGVYWAGRNVDAPGTFTTSPENYGMFYQWNRKKGWPSTGSVSDWDESVSSGDTWEAANSNGLTEELVSIAGQCLSTALENAVTATAKFSISARWILRPAQSMPCSEKTGRANQP